MDADKRGSEQTNGASQFEARVFSDLCHPRQSAANSFLMPTHDIIIIGGGHNGLVTACYLAKAGLKPLVVERRDIVGGACLTEEFHPGFRCSTLAHATGPLLPAVIKDLRLEERGLEIIKPATQ